MKTATLLLLISALWGVAAHAASISFSNIPSTNVVNATDQLLLNSHIGGTNYSTRTLTVTNLTSTVRGQQTNVAAANPTATVATTAVNGSALTFMRSDAAPAIPASFITANQTNATLASLGGVTTNAPNIAAGSIASFSSSNTLAAATSAQITNALGFMPVNKAGDTIVSLETSEMIISNATASSFAYLDAGKVLTNAPYTPANKAGESFSGLVSSPSAAISDLLFGASQVSRGTLTHAGGNLIIDFALTNRYWSCTITGNVTILPTNAVAGKWANVILRMPATNCTPVFASVPTGSTTNWFGGAPSTLTANTIGTLSFYAIDSTTNSCLAAYAETQ